MAARLKTEPPGWRRECLLAVQLGLAGELSLDQIARSAGRARSTIQEWFDAYRTGGVDALLRDGRADNPGQPGKLTYGSSGTAGATHLTCELFRVMAGTVTAETPCVNADTGKSERLGHLLKLEGKKTREVEAATIGREGAVGGIVSEGHKPAFGRAVCQEVLGAGDDMVFDARPLEPLSLPPHLGPNTPAGGSGLTTGASGRSIWAKVKAKTPD